jgi:hypothetical protein
MGWPLNNNSYANQMKWSVFLFISFSIRRIFNANSLERVAHKDSHQWTPVFLLLELSISPSPKTTPPPRISHPIHPSRQLRWGLRQAGGQGQTCILNCSDCRTDWRCDCRTFISYFKIWNCYIRLSYRLAM